MLSSASGTVPKARFHISPEAYLVGVAIISGAILLNHVAQGWSSASADPSDLLHNKSSSGINFSHKFTGDTGTGLWGIQTSAMNFCEQDYSVTATMAEFINTISNLAYMWYAYRTWPSSHKWPPVANISLFAVGVTSALFHASLKHYSQIADESGMYLLVASMNWKLYSFPGAVFGGRITKPLYTVILLGACILVICVNLVSDGADFGIHTILFSILCNMLWPRCLYLISCRGQRERKNATPSSQIRSTALRRKLRLGALCILLGFGAWLADCILCYELRTLRSWLGLPLAWFTELHGWWHILTAVGAGKFVELTHDLSDARLPRKQM